MNIFITGATGFVGSVFLKELLSKKCFSIEKIYILQREKSEYKDKRVFVLEGDLLGINKYRKELISSDYVFHIAANATFGNGIDYEKVNYIPTKNIVDILKKSKKLKDFIFISTIGAVDRSPKDRVIFPLNNSSIPHPRSDYGNSKLKSENYIVSSKIPFTIIRPTWVYGSDMRSSSHINKFVSLIKNNKWLSLFNFPGKVSLIHVKDLAFSLVECINNSDAINKIFFAETECLSIGKIFEVIHRNIFKTKNKQIKVPSFKLFFKYCHGYLPLLIDNLFIDYLSAIDIPYRNILLKNKKTIKFRDGINDVVATNVDVNGYWVITGANSGIGHSLANLLNKKKKNIILIDKNINNLSVFNELFVLKCDLSKDDDLKKISSFLKDKKIFCLVNNAAIGIKKDFFDMTVQEFNLIIDINIKAVFLLILMLKNNLLKNKTIIVNIGSSAGYSSLPGMSVYAATKSFVINLTRSLIEENKNKIILFSPSGTATNFQKNSGVHIDTQKQNLLNPDEVALKIFNIVESGGSKEVLLGIKSKFLVLFSRVTPFALNTKIQGFLFKKLR